MPNSSLAGSFILFIEATLVNCPGRVCRGCRVCPGPGRVCPGRVCLRNPLVTKMPSYPLHARLLSLFFLLATPRPSYAIDPYPLSLHAEQLFEEILYLDALPHYKELWHHHRSLAHTEEASFFLLRLATCYYQIKNHLALQVLLHSPLVVYS